MKILFPKFMAILGMLLICSYFQNVYSQSKKTNYDVTSVMARKIGYYCQYNQRALSLFAMANPEQVQNRRDRASRLIRELEKHLDCAENFILTLYYNYGVEMSYFALKDAGFTIKETDIAESIWAKDSEKQDKIREKKEIVKRKAELSKEKDIFDLATHGEYFGFHALTVLPEITIDAADLARTIDFWKIEQLIDWGTLIDCSFNCVISKDGVLSLASPVDSETFNSTQKLLFDYLINNAIIQNPASITFKQLNTTVKVNSKATIRFEQEARRLKNSIQFKVKKDKKSERWKIINDVELRIQLNRVSKNDAEAIYYDIEGLLYNNPYFKAIEKGTYSVKAEILANEIKYLIEGKEQERGQLSYTFEFESK
ncbi:hypothetical protein [Dysgonomonas capnocytophagoides]|uniref:hypothetical protein n=1 Tax=Dysgonomonas capnocytophagoides TaxID=45254 RepID=UPI00042A73DA|nr:hypothetical protein [Dysgonomonas capnocytophagoides]